MTDNRRTRVQSLPTSSLPDELSQALNDQRIFESDIEEDNFEADDEATRQMNSRRPSTVAKEEIAQAHENLSHISSSKPSPNLSSASSVQSSAEGSKTSLFGSLYSLGSTVLSFIRGKIYNLN